MTSAPVSASSSVAILGGGRWARTIAGVLAGLCGDDRDIILCSPNYPEGWDIWLQARPADQRRTFVLNADLAGVLRNPRVGSVLVVRAASDNAATALAALKAGKATFVEKPLALASADAERVAAAAAGIRCMVGHVMLFASNLRAFAAASAELGTVRKIAIEWHDAKGEFRYGETKRYDHSINVVQDVFPHVWSLVRLVIADALIRLRHTESSDGGRCVALALIAGDADITISVQREAKGRKRSLRVSADRGLAEIDFTIEPGLARINDRMVDVATGFKSPLALELSHFLNPSSDAADPAAARFASVESAVETIALSEAALGFIHAQQASAIRAGMRHGASVAEGDSAVFALREWIAGERRAIGAGSGRGSAEDEQAARQALRWLAHAGSDAPPSELIGARWIGDLGFRQST